MNNPEQTNYLTVGELAKKAGVTVRTLQFYDQKGLLSPSMKGAGNKRLYSAKDQERLHAVLCCKYMGMSLDEIKALLDSGATPADVQRTLHTTSKQMEKAISDHMKRYAIIRDLENLSHDGMDPDSWTAFSEVIDYINAKWEMIWQFNNALENENSCIETPADSTVEMKQYYNLLADTIRLINEGTDPEDDAMMDVIARYYDMDPNRPMIHVDPDNMKVGTNKAYDIWTNIKDYMQKAADHYVKTRGEQEDKK